MVSETASCCETDILVVDRHAPTSSVPKVLSTYAAVAEPAAGGRAHTLRAQLHSPGSTLQALQLLTRLSVCTPLVPGRLGAQLAHSVAGHKVAREYCWEAAAGSHMS